MQQGDENLRPRGHGGFALDRLIRDMRYGMRTLWRSPGYSLLVVITLALGIGANTAIFSVVNGVLLRPLPYQDGHELVLARQSAMRAGAENIPFSVKEIIDYRDLLETLDGFVEYHGMSFTLLNRGEPDRVLTGVVSSNFFDVLGVQPLLGRSFVETDDDLGAEAVLVLSYPYWQQRFGGDPNVVGAVFEMNDQPHTVVGVLPPIPQYPRDNDVYMPTSACPFRARGEARMHEDRTAFRGMTAFGRLRDGVTVERFGTDLATVAGRLQQDFPDVYEPESGYTAVTAPLTEELTSSARPMLLILLGTTGLVLLIACANVANLTLARMLRRERELALRSALGAGRGRILAQVLTETTLLAVVGAGLGLVLAGMGLDLLVSFAGMLTPRTSQISIDGWVLAFTLAVAVATGLAFGIAPALSARANVTALKEGGAQTTDAGTVHWFRNVLTIAQVAVSFMLLVGAGLLLASFYKLQQVDPGFRPDNVLTAEVFPNWSKYRTPESRRQLFTGVLERIESRPGVLSAAAASDVPLEGQPARQQAFEIEGRRYEDPDLRPELELRVASPGYFETIGVGLLSGRAFTNLDDEEGLGVAIISRSLAQRHWPDSDPIDRRVTLNGGRDWLTIVGVVGDVRYGGLDSEPPDALYRPFLQVSGATRILVRARMDPLSLATEVREAVHDVDAEQPVESFSTLEQARTDTLATRRLTMLLLAIFAALALVITVTGIAGVVATSVSQRTREFGVRMALGAEPASLLRMVMRQGLTMVILGLLLGLAGALALSRVLASLLFDTMPTDPSTFAIVSVVLLVAALAACFLPARRTMRVDPMVALRTE
ncbi:MAG: ABC transporter permease [Vicinamibacterales bacterium]|jgi:putative ABC transport system permease protein|nr:ABC transporter permease [Vicinamibacterales bacterium]